MKTRAGSDKTELLALVWLVGLLLLDAEGKLTTDRRSIEATHAARELAANALDKLGRGWAVTGMAMLATAERIRTRTRTARPGR